jgi:ketosteroid isomerase-like protein
MTQQNHHAEIRKRIETFTQALRTKDIEALWAHYAPDVMTFDLRPPLQANGLDYRKNFETWFASVQGPIDYEVHDQRIAVNGNLAFCHSLSHVRSTRTGGERADYWVRVTAGFEKINGQWLITHEHISMPISMETMRAWSP